jgi:hypothetical protein
MMGVTQRTASPLSLVINGRAEPIDFSVRQTTGGTTDVTEEERIWNLAAIFIRSFSRPAIAWSVMSLIPDSAIFHKSFPSMRFEQPQTPANRHFRLVRLDDRAKMIRKVIHYNSSDQ